MSGNDLIHFWHIADSPYFYYQSLDKSALGLGHLDPRKTVGCYYSMI